MLTDKPFNSWSNEIPHAVTAHNRAPQPSRSNLSPSQMYFGQSRPRLGTDRRLAPTEQAAAAARTRQDTRAKENDKRRPAIKPNVGDIVLVTATKAEQAKYGPLRGVRVPKVVVATSRNGRLQHAKTVAVMDDNGHTQDANVDNMILLQAGTILSRDSTTSKKAVVLDQRAQPEDMLLAQTPAPRSSHSSQGTGTTSSPSGSTTRSSDAEDVVLVERGSQDKESRARPSLPPVDV